MTDLNIYGGILILVLAGVIIGIKMYRNRKTNPISMDEFIDTYGDQVIAVLQDIIKILKINMNDFKTKEEYEEALITATINALKENSIEFGIPVEVVELLDTESLTKIVQKILNQHRVDAFSVLDAEDVDKNKNLLSDEVVDVLGSAEVTDTPEANTVKPMETVISEVKTETQNQ